MIQLKMQANLEKIHHGEFYGILEFYDDKKEKIQQKDVKEKVQVEFVSHP